MAILSAQSFVQACYWVSRFWGQLEMDFNAVERVQEYLGIPQEPPAIIEGRRPPAYWPSSDSGDEFLSVRDLEIKYAPDLPSVFKGSFDVKAGEKIGLIGRTGSGKSTLAMSLLRFTEPTSGSIWLDGIDITSIGVDDLVRTLSYTTLRNVMLMFNSDLGSLTSHKVSCNAETAWISGLTDTIRRCSLLRNGEGEPGSVQRAFG